MKTYVKLPDDLAKKLDAYSVKYGLSKSGFMAYSLAKHINEIEAQADAYKSVTDKISTIVDDISKREVSNHDFESFSINEK